MTTEEQIAASIFEIIRDQTTTTKKGWGVDMLVNDQLFTTVRLSLGSFRFYITVRANKFEIWPGYTGPHKPTGPEWAKTEIPIADPDSIPTIIKHANAFIKATEPKTATQDSTNDRRSPHQRTIQT